jgi:hypothetical protein
MVINEGNNVLKITSPKLIISYAHINPTTSMVLEREFETVVDCGERTFVHKITGERRFQLPELEGWIAWRRLSVSESFFEQLLALLNF